MKKSEKSSNLIVKMCALCQVTQYEPLGPADWFQSKV